MSNPTSDKRRISGSKPYTAPLPSKGRKEKFLAVVTAVAMAILFAGGFWMLLYSGSIPLMIGGGGAIGLSATCAIASLVLRMRAHKLKQQHLSFISNKKFDTNAISSVQLALFIEDFNSWLTNKDVDIKSKNAYIKVIKSMAIYIILDKALDLFPPLIKEADANAVLATETAKAARRAIKKVADETAFGTTTVTINATKIATANTNLANTDNDLTDAMAKASANIADAMAKASANITTVAEANVIAKAYAKAATAYADVVAAALAHTMACAAGTTLAANYANTAAYMYAAKDADAYMREANQGANCADQSAGEATYFVKNMNKFFKKNKKWLFDSFVSPYKNDNNQQKVMQIQKLIVLYKKDSENKDKQTPPPLIIELLNYLMDAPSLMAT